MRKYDLISALSAETSKEVARNEESWKKYLNTASRLYKYRSKTSSLSMPKDRMPQPALP